MAADWSMLPLDPLGAIAMKFTIVDDFIRFSAVCRGWNLATSVVEDQWKAPLPSLLLAENTKQNPGRLRKIFDLNNDQIYQLKLPETFGRRCWGSPYGWVAIADEDRNVQLFNPITKAQIHFPSLKFLTHHDDDEEELVFDDGFVPVDDGFDNGVGDLGDCHSFLFLRAYLFKLIVVKVSQNGKHVFVLMVIYDCRQYVDFAREGDETWTSVSTKEYEYERYAPKKKYTKIIDIVAKGDDIFALYRDGSIVHWHASDFCSSKHPIPRDYSPPGLLDIVPRPIRGQLQKYLVESHGDLMLVVRYTEEIDCKYNPKMVDRDVGYQTKAIDVFKLTQHNGWEKIEDLGNVALFVGGNYSMSVSLGMGQRLQHNGIYFTDDEYVYWGVVREFGGHDTGFYDMKLNKSLFFKHDDMRSLFCPSTWFIPRL